MVFLKLLCLLLMVKGSSQAEESPIHTTFEYEYPEYSCAAQKATAVLRAVAVKNRAEHPVLSLTSVMDVSGSMNTDGKLKLLQATNDYLVDRLAREEAGHKFGSVVFSTNARELTPLQILTEETKKDVQSQINGTVAAGLTNLLGGIEAGVRQQIAAEPGNYVRVVFVFTDGKPTRGERDSTKIAAAVRQLVAEAKGNVAIYTFGFGEDLEFELLGEIADVGKGVLYVLSDEVDVPRAFGSALGGLLTSVALNLHYLIRPTGNAKVAAVRSGGIVDETPMGTVLHLGDLFMQERRDVVVKVQLSNTCTKGDSVEIQESFVDAVTFEEVSRNIDVNVVDRLGSVPTVRTDLTPAAIDAIRYELVDRLEVAATSLAQDDLPTCVQKCEEAELYIVKGGYTKIPYLESIRADIETVRKEIQTTPGVTIEDQATLGGVIDAVKKQRTGLTDPKYKTVGQTTTVSQRKTQKEATKSVLPGQVQEKFPMKLSYAVSGIVQKEDYDEIEVVLTIRAPALKQSQPPLYVTSVLDKSGSMYGDAFDLMIKTQKRMIDWLLGQKTSKISLGVILFSSDVVTFQKLKSISEIDVPDLKWRLGKAVAEGTTELGRALRLGVQEQLDHPKCGGRQAVFLLTDGVPSSGRDTIVKELKTMLSTAKYPISVYAFGLGDFDAELLKEIADAGKGQLYILRDEADIASSFGDAAGGLLSVAAKNVKVDIDVASPDVTIRSVFPNLEGFSDNYASVSFVDMFKDETREVLLSLKVPKDADLKELLDVDVSYSDVISCKRHQKTHFQVLHKKTSTATTKRMLEKHVVDIFREASKDCLSPRTLQPVIDHVSEAIDIVAQSTYKKGSYKADLLADLMSVRKTLKAAQKGEVPIEKACLKLDGLKDLLITQRTKGTSGRVYRVEKYYDTDSRQKTRSDFAGTVQKIPTRPKEDVFQASYLKAPEEISSAPQTLNINLTLDSIPAPATQTPASVVFIVDGSETTTAEQLETMKTIVVQTWKVYENSEVFKSAYLAIVVHGATVTVVLDKTLFSDVTTEEIEAIFDTIVPAGEGDFIGGVRSGFGILENISEQHDLVMVCLIGKSLKMETAADDAKAYDTEMSQLDYPLTFLPLMMQEDAPAEYFDSFQHSAKSHLATVSGDYGWQDASRRIRSACFFTAAKRVRVLIQPTGNVSVVSVDGKSPNPSGEYHLPDLHYEEELTFPVTLDIDEYVYSQLLFVASFKYFDMRSFFTWDKQMVPFVVSRVEPEMLERRIQVRDSTKDTLKDVEKTIRDGKLDGALSDVAYKISIIIREERQDVVLHEVVGELEDVLQMIYSLYTGDEKEHRVIKRIRQVQKKLDVPTYVPPTPVNDTQPVMPFLKKEKDEPEPSRPPVPEETVKVTFDHPDVTDASDTNMTVDVAIESPPPTGHVIDAHVTIILDSSATADAEIVDKLSKALISLLANRRGTRSISVYTWNEQLTLVYTSDDFGKEQIPDVLKAIEESTPSGTADYNVVFQDGIPQSQNPNVTAAVLFWLVTSSVQEGVDTDALLETAKTHFGDGTPALTIHTFGSGLDDTTKKLVTDLSDLSGGQHTQLDHVKTEEQAEKDHDIDDVARKAVMWIDTTYVKKVIIDVKPLEGTTIKDIILDDVQVSKTDSGIVASSLPYGHSVTVEVVLSLGATASKQKAGKPPVPATDVMEISGQYFHLRDKEPKSFNSTVSVSRADKKTIKEIDFLSDAMDKSAEATMQHLGKNAVDDALVEITKFRILAEHSGVKKQPQVEEYIVKHEKIEHYLSNFVEDRKQFSAAQLVAETIGSLKPGQQYISDHGKFVSSKHKRESAVEDDVVFKPVLTINTPSLKKPLKPRHLTVLAVFDAADYTTLLESEVSILLTQTMTVSEILRKLVSEHGYEVTLLPMISRDGGTKMISSIEVNSKTVDKVEPKLEKIVEKGQPADLYSSLQAGLEEMGDMSDGSDRLMLLFSAAFSVCIVKDPRYDELLAPYITHPIAPVKVMTYIIGPTEAGHTDPISSLTGGSKYYINTMNELDDAVADSVDKIKGILLHGVRLHISPSSWMNNTIDVGSNGYRIESFPKWTAALPDLKAGASHSVELNVPLDAWSGDADVFEYSFSFFYTPEQRWFTTPVETVRVKRAPKNVLRERNRLRFDSTKALDKSTALIDKKNIDQAVETLQNALKTIDETEYQDDSVIIELTQYLTELCKDLVKLANNETDQQIDALLHRVETNRAELGLNSDSPAVGNGEDEDDAPTLSIAVRSILFFGSVASAVIFLLILSKL